MTPLKLAILLATIITITAGCGTPEVWYQEGRSSADAHKDLAACRLAAGHPGYGAAAYHAWGYLGNQVEAGKYIKDSMMGKGYKPTPVNTVTNGADYPRL